MTRYRKILLSLLLVLTLAMSGAGWLLYSAAGTQWLLKRLPGWTGIELTIAQIDGTLGGSLHLADIAVSTGTMQLHLGQLFLHHQRPLWRPLTLEIAELRLEQLQITTPPAADNGATQEFHWPTLPWFMALLSLDIHAIELRDFRWQHPGQSPVQIDRYRGDLHWHNNQLLSREFNLHSAELDSSGSFCCQFNQPALHLDTRLTAPAAGSTWQQARLKINLDAATTGQIIQGSAALELTPATGEPLAATAQLALSHDQLHLRHVQIRRAKRPGTVTASGHWQFTGSTPQLTAQLAIDNLDLHAESGQPLQLSGTIDVNSAGHTYTGQFDLHTRGDAIAAARLGGEFRGNAESLALTNLDGDWLAGTVTGQMQLGWQQGWQLTADLVGHQINPQRLHPQLAGQLNFELHAAFDAPAPQHRHGQLRLHLHDSVLHDQPLSASAQLQLQDTTLVIEQLQLHGDGLQLQAHGNPAEQLVFNWQIERLEQLVAEATGQCSGEGWLRWHNHTLHAAVHSSAKQLSFAHWQLDRLNLEAQTLSAAGAWQLHLSGQQLHHRQRAVVIEQIDLDIDGSLAQHALTLKLAQPPAGMTAHFNGGWDGQQWRGELARWHGTDFDARRWALHQPVALRLGADQLSIDPLTVRHAAGGSLDFHADYLPQHAQGNAQLTWQQLDLTLFRPLLADWQLSGASSGSVTMQRGATSRLHGKISATADVEHRQLALQGTRSDILFDWDEQGLRGTLDVQLEKHGYITTEFNVPLATTHPLAFTPHAAVSATLHARLQELGLLALFFPERIQESHGQLQLDVQLAGDWQHPALRGTFRLTDAGIYLPSLGIPVTAIDIEGDFADHRITLERGQFSSGAGKLTATGRLELQHWRPAAYHLKLSGENVQLINLPELQVDASPDLTMDGSADTLRVRGQILFPTVMVRGRQPAAVASNSPDLVVIDRESTTPPPSRFQHDIDVNLRLGERVFLNSAGIDAQLEGRLQMQSTAGQELVGNGKINIAKGRYSSYGVSLDIERGNLLFSGGALDQPLLDILALRNIGDVQAGVTVSGTPKAPIVQLYSEPAMADTDILSYIVLGRPIAAGSGQTNLLMTAAGTLLSQGESVMLQEKLKTRLGLDVLDISAGDGEVNTAIITTGKYLSPDLYISLGYSLFNNSNEVKVRYTITPDWEIESSIGNESGVDMFYRIEIE